MGLNATKTIIYNLPNEMSNDGNTYSDLILSLML